MGNVNQFAQEFEENLLVIDYAVAQFGLPADLKLSVHSGSDKFSLYPHINRLIKEHDAILHLKTAGATWLEELSGLAAAGGQGLTLVAVIYKDAFERLSELTEPYTEVIKISKEELPAPDKVAKWERTSFIEALDHDEENPAYNSSF